MMTEEKSELIQGGASRAVQEHPAPLKGLLSPLTSEDDDAELDSDSTESY